MKSETLTKVQIILDIIVILFISAALLYFVIHRNELLALIKGPCNMCFEKTGAICSIPRGIN